jgi:hypothetical protein
LTPAGLEEELGLVEFGGFWARLKPELRFTLSVTDWPRTIDLFLRVSDDGDTRWEHHLFSIAHAQFTEMTAKHFRRHLAEQLNRILRELMPASCDGDRLIGAAS